MWSSIATTGTKASPAKDDIKKANDHVKELHEKIKPSGVGIDVADWATDDVYFNRVFKKYSTENSKADGSSTGERLINKEDGEKSLREILNEKIDTSGDKKK